MLNFSESLNEVKINLNLSYFFLFIRNRDAKGYYTPRTLAVYVNEKLLKIIASGFRFQEFR